jgi:hypothetical protein
MVCMYEFPVAMPMHIFITIRPQISLQHPLLPHPLLSLLTILDHLFQRLRTIL